MPSNKPTDELLTALADIGLGLWMMDNTASDKWNVQLYDPGKPLERYEGRGTTPAAALIAALTDAGVDVSDE